MMHKFYFIPTTYIPNTAATNRAISYIKGFSELGIETTVVDFCPDEQMHCYSESHDHVVIKHYWKHFFLNIGPLKYISLLLYYLLFLFNLKPGDTILIYSSANIWYWIKRIKPKVRIFLEHTENPEVVGIGGKFLTPSWDNYFNSLPKLDGIFVITTALKDYFINKGVEPERIHIANITVDPSRFANVTKQPHSERRIVYCGTASNNKDGVDQLIKSFALVASKYEDVKLYILGPVPKNDEVGNLKLIKDLQLEERIVLTGMISAKDMPQHLVNADILALDRPNNIQAKYGFATKMGEYLLSKNPVVLTRVGDFDLFLSDKESAVFAEPDNCESFAKCLSWVLDNEGKSIIIGEKGRDVAMRYFSYTKVVNSVCSAIGL